MSRAALVLGANAGQADLIRRLKADGWFVWASAGRAGEPGAKICDRFIQVDITDTDALAAIVTENDIDLIYSISSDVAIRAATAVSAKTGRPHFYDKAFIDLLDDKSALRRFLTERGLDGVRFEAVNAPDQAKDWSRFPCIVKPVDAQGQRGVMRVERAADLAPALDQAIAASVSGLAIVEELLSGVEISCNTLVARGEIRHKILSERLVHADIGFGIPAGHLLPPRNVSAAHLAAADAKVVAIIDALGRRDGPLYFQMIVTEDGPRVVEIAPRLDGCHMWRVIKAGIGVDFIAETVAALTGGALDQAPETEPEAPLELMFQQIKPGVAFATRDFPPPADAIYHEYRYDDGETINPINGLYEVVGYYVRRSDQ